MADNYGTPGNGSVFDRLQKYERLRGELETERSSFITHWRDLNDYILPRRGRFQVTDSNKGDRRNLKIIDSTGTFAARTLSAGMMSGLTSPARPWFRLTHPDPKVAELPAVKVWLDTVTRLLQTIFVKSNLYNALATIYQDIGVFGTSAMIVEEDDEDIIRCYPFPIGTYTLANDYKLRVRTFCREFRMTVRQLIERFGEENVSKRVKSMWNLNQREQWIEVVHVITENDIYDADKLESKHKPFASCYYEKGSNEGKFLEETGFDEFPVLAPRWAVTGEDVYGTDCPGMTVLGDVKQLQMGEKKGMQAIEKMISPPMVGPSSLKTVKASLLPGDITYSDEREGMKGFRPIHEVNPRIQELEMKQNACRSRIERGFFADLFLMLQYSDSQRGSQPVTAREVEERHEEKLLALGPVLEQFNQDLADPLIDRTFAIMWRKGVIPPPPPELEGVAIKAEYISIMAQAQKMVGLSGLERFAGFVGQVAASDPSVLDKVDRDQMVDEYGEMTGISPRIIVSDEKVQAVRQARAEAAKQQAAMEQAQQASVAAKNLAQSDTSGKNALTDLVNGGAATAAANGQLTQSLGSNYAGLPS